jgi:hypothetical protein
MAYNFLAHDRDQAFLLPPDLCDWLPADHLAWFTSAGSSVECVPDLWRNGRGSDQENRSVRLCAELLCEVPDPNAELCSALLEAPRGHPQLPQGRRYGGRQRLRVA